MPGSRPHFSEYPSELFDCDGVLLNSNKVKTEAFRKVAQQFGSSSADALVAYHVENGGVSRQVKFRYLLDSIVSQPTNGANVESLCRQFSEEVVDQLMLCDVSPGLKRLRKTSAKSTWYVVSGGDQAELRQVFAARDLASMFDGGIYGSPTAKTELLAHIKSRPEWRGPGLFLGDSRYDWQVASEHGLDFIFVSGWSEFSGWQKFCEARSIEVIDCLDEL